MKDKFIKKVEEGLSAFGRILNDLNEDRNLVLGGTVALKLHGLEVGRKPDDIDIIIYRPTERQTKALELLEDFSEYDDGYGDNFKFKKNGHTLNILVEEAKMPNNLLRITLNRTECPVQSISGVISAKVSYGRNKDLKDLLKYKALNFNANK